MTTVTGACCRRTGAYAFDRVINAYHTGRGRAGADDRHQAEIAFDAAGDALAPALVK